MSADGTHVTAAFPRLFQPFEIKGKRFKNRLFLAPHGTGYAVGGRLGAAALGYYGARLEGGVALVYTEATQVVPITGQGYAQLTGASEEFVEDVARLAELCAGHDARCFVQLYHEGRARAHSVDGSVEAVIAPSAVRDERFHVVPREMSLADIRDLTDRFAAAAGRAARGGADGVELLVGMGYLHGQFLSPRINRRTDAYGGTAENRIRFLMETLAAMREAAGPDVLIGYRIVPEDGDPDGLRLKDSLPVCKATTELGLSDFISVTVGSTHTLAGTASIVPSMFTDAGAARQLGRAVREATGAPVFVTGRINQPQIAEEALEAGDGDMIGMVRALLTDPQLPEKARTGRAEDIRACIGCNQACIGHRNRGHGVSCIQYPESGRELAYGRRAPVDRPRRIVVVGGGPAGMKAAAVAAERGHEIVLMEKSGQLGGQALLAQALPGRAEFGGIVTNLAHEIDRHGVDIRLRAEADPEAIAALSPDAVILATGARPHRPEGEFEDAHLVQAWDVIAGRARPGPRVLVADWRCDWIGPGVAEMLARDGHAVTLAVNGEGLGQSLQQYLRFQLAGRLHELGVRVIPYMRLFGADEDSVYLQHVVTGAPAIVEEIDTLVLAWGSEAELGLHAALGRSAPDLPVHLVGDCLSPRTAEEAVLDALKCAADI
jgi:2,4-dienoyl-CoA reductase-like NADH-dependent reductase (Old Yellow Enzyme family)